jgi:4-hydroxybenzoate polyprenyltransferase
MTTVGAYGRLVRFSHTLFAMPFALLSAVLAGRGAYGPGLLSRQQFWAQLGLIILCMVAARCAAMTFNRIADLAYDRQNPRTAGRPLVRGELTLAQAWGFYAACSAAFVALCGLFWLTWGNGWPLALSLPVLAVLSGYSLTKRWTCLCHLVLGLADGLAPLAAWIAINPAGVGLSAVELLLAMAFWIGGFDILYALADRELDIRLGLHSLPVALGPVRVVWVSRLCHVAALGLLAGVAANERGVLGGLYLAALAVAVVVLAWQHKTLRPEIPAAMERVFFIGNALVGTLVGAAGIINALI